MISKRFVFSCKIFDVVLNQGPIKSHKIMEALGKEARSCNDYIDKMLKAKFLISSRGCEGGYEVPLHAIDTNAYDIMKICTPEAMAHILPAFQRMDQISPATIRAMDDLGTSD